MALEKSKNYVEKLYKIISKCNNCKWKITLYGKHTKAVN